MALSIQVGTWLEAQPNWMVVIYGAAPTSTGRTRPPSSWKYLYKIYAEDLGTEDYGSFYTAKFGEPPAGAKIWLKFDVINDLTGLGSVPFVTSAIVGT